MDKYYNGGKILQMKDLNGQTPEIFMVSGNRSAGKTTYFSRKLVNMFLEKRRKFVLLYRYKYMVTHCENSFFGNLKMFYPNCEMTGKTRQGGIYYELFLNGKSCGYALALNNPDTIKNISSMFYDVDAVLFDEFQATSDAGYCSDEISKFISVHQSMARGGGKQSRYLPVYMLSNKSSLLNPYFTAFGISDRLRSDTKFMRGTGWVLEMNKNEHAAQAQAESTFMQAFAGSQFYAHSVDNMYLNDNIKFVERMGGNNKYMATIKFNNCEYSIREYDTPHVIYVSTGVDSNNPVKIAVTGDDHQTDYVLKQSYNYLITNLRIFYNWGLIRFQNLNCKSAFLGLISY